MLKNQIFNYRLMPTREQEQKMYYFASVYRYVYNRALELQKERFEKGKKKLSYTDLVNLLNRWRNNHETLWLVDVPYDLQQQALINLEQDFENFFEKRAEFPKFKKRGRHERFRFSGQDVIKLEQNNNRLYIPELGWLRYRNSREVIGTIKSVTVSQNIDNWYVNILTEREFIPPTSRGGVVGIKINTNDFITLSD